MDTLISKFLGEISIITLFSLVVIAIKNIIDNKNLLEIEKLLMTDWKKFKIDFSNYGVYTFFILSIGSFYIAVYNPSSISNISPSITTTIIAFGIVWLIVTFAFILLFNAIIWVDRKVSLHNEFFILLDDNEKWKILKMKNESSLLVERDSNYRIVDNWNNKNITYELVYHFPLKKIYNLWPITKLRIIFRILIIGFIVAFIYSFTLNNLISFPLAFFSVFFILILLIIWVNYREYIKFISQNNE